MKTPTLMALRTVGGILNTPNGPRRVGTKAPWPLDDPKGEVELLRCRVQTLECCIRDLVSRIETLEARTKRPVRRRVTR